ncbi:MAG: hypothetical protein GX372_00210 [Ignavibacteria bacterium]|nr:hypothetical protein [Ignavibacteria bacterium]
MKQTLSIVFFFILLSQLKSATYVEDFYWEAMEITPRAFNSIYWYEIYFLPQNPQYGFVCGDYGSFAKTTDGGKTWQASQITTEYFHAESVFFANEYIGYVSGVEGIFKTTDGGNSWNKLKIPLLVDKSGKKLPYTNWGHYIIGPDNVWLVAGDCQSGSQQIARSHDGGITWQDTVFYVDDSRLTDITIYDKNGLGYAIGSGYIFRTLDGGKFWELFASTPVFSWIDPYMQVRISSSFNWHEDIQNYKQSFIIPVSMTCPGSTHAPGGIAFSENNGKTWNIKNTKASMFGTFILDEKTGFACGKDNEIYYTTDAGKTWQDFNCGIPPNRHLDDLFFINDTTGFVVGQGIYQLKRKNKVLTTSGKLNICKDKDSYTVLKANEKFNYYNWYQIKDNDTNLISTEDTAHISEEGKYFVEGFDFDCYKVFSKVLEVTFLPGIKVEIKTDKQKYCSGDTAFVTFEKSDEILDFTWYDNSKKDTIQITESGNYWIDFIDTNGCKTKIEFSLDFTKLESPNLAVRGKKKFCIGGTTTIFIENPDEYSDIIWFCNDKEIDRNKNEITARTEGKYYVYVSKNNDCYAFSDTVLIEVIYEKNTLSFELNDNPVFIDSVAFPQMSCKDLIITNNSNKEFVLENVLFFHKISFTAPMTQFPLKIPANSKANLTICYSPQALSCEYDTLFFDDICSEHLIGLSGCGLPRKDSSIIHCGLPIKISTKEIIRKNRFHTENPFPNPILTKTSIKFIVFIDKQNNSLDENAIFISLKNTLGENIPIEKNIRIDGYLYEQDGTFISGEIQISPNDVSSGVYFLQIMYASTNYFYNLIVN